MAAPVSAPPGAQWFALHTLSGQEGKVKNYIEKFKKVEELDDHIFEILLPTEVVSEVKGGKKTTKVRKLYPGYVFIQMLLHDEEGKLINKPWYFVKETTGVIGFVGGDKADHAGGLLDEIPRLVDELAFLVVEEHLDENVAGIKLADLRGFLAALHLGDNFRRQQDFKNVVV